MPFRSALEDSVDVAHALSVGETLMASMHDEGVPSAYLYGASLRGAARVLGHWQRRASVLGKADDAALAHVFRRRTGGPAVFAGEGVVYAALALRHASVLMDCPADRVLNRNVRGFLGALSECGTPAHYFGREWLSVHRQPVAAVGWARGADGSVLVEAFIGVSRSPFVSESWPRAAARKEEAMLGKTPATLAVAADRAIEDREVLEWLTKGFALRYEHEPPTEGALDAAIRERAKLTANEKKLDRRSHLDPDMHWSSAREIPIGFLEAGLGRNDVGIVTRACLAGDFFADDAADKALAERLVGHPPSTERFASAINGVFDGHAHILEGLKSLQPVLDAFVELATAPR